MVPEPRRFKDAMYEQFARIGKAVAAPKRLELLELLCQGPRTVEALGEQAGMSVANASQHLLILRAARLVASERAGAFVRYRLASDEVCAFYLALRGLARARLAEVDNLARDYFEGRGVLEAIASDELLRRVKRGAVTVVDVRPREEYAEAHLPGAISIPLGELRKRLRELPRDRGVVAYCRGPYCVMAIEAVEVLRSRGFEAHRLSLGVADWRAAGGRVQRAATKVATQTRRGVVHKKHGGH